MSLALISNAQSSGLIWVALGGNGITDKGAEHLAFALKIQHAPNGPLSRMTTEQGIYEKLTIILAAKWLVMTLLKI